MEAQEQRKEQEVRMQKRNETIMTLEHFQGGPKGKINHTGDFMKPHDRTKVSQLPLIRNPETKIVSLKIYASKKISANVDVNNNPREVKMKDLIFFMQRDPHFRKSKLF